MKNTPFGVFFLAKKQYSFVIIKLITMKAQSTFVFLTTL